MRGLPATAALAAFVAGTSFLSACSLCGNRSVKDTLTREMERADLVLYGRLANPKLATRPGALPGSGTTEFHFDRVLKGDLPGKDMLVLDRYLPVIDEKDPPRYLMFCRRGKDRIDPYDGRPVRSKEALEYLRVALEKHRQGKVAALLHHAAFLDHPDPVLAEDAYLEFARAKDDEVGEAARQLPPRRFRKLIEDPRTPAERLGLFAFLLAGSGDLNQAEFLKDHAARRDARTLQALDGFLCGYMTLRPMEGWALAETMLADRKENFAARYAVLRAIRFHYNWKPKENRPAMLRALAGLLRDPEYADLAVEDLRKWQVWDLTPQVLDLFGRPEHDAPITRRTIVRYALCCPLSEARTFLDQVRKTDGEMVREVAEGLGK